jgi:very-short-patch-repair endonuclease
MNMPKNNALLENARHLRKGMTPQERKLWYLFLRSYPAKVYKQRIIGSYIVDFYCASAKLVIEIDGSQHYEQQGQKYDSQRSEYLNSLGLFVVRYSNADINYRFEQVCESIHQHLQQRIP